MAQVATCRSCGKEFNPKRSWQRYCSENCRVTFWDNIVQIPRIAKPESALDLEVKCKPCISYLQGAASHTYHWRNARVEIRACGEHLQQIIYILNRYQEIVWGTETGERDIR